MYRESVDGETKHGSSFGLPRRPIIGGSWGYESYSGSRFLNCSNFSSNEGMSIATRGCMNIFIILGLVGIVRMEIIGYMDIIGMLNLLGLN